MIEFQARRSLRLASALLALAVLTACTAADDAASDTSAAVAAAAAGMGGEPDVEARVVTIDTTLAPYAHFTGELPCDDCEAVRTELTLWTDPHRYLLSETFVGRTEGDTTLERLGEWLDLRGRPGEPDARVVQLRFETAGDPRSYLMIGGDETSPGSELRQLDAQQQPMPSPERWTLSRQP